MGVASGVASLDSSCGPGAVTLPDMIMASAMESKRVLGMGIAETLETWDVEKMQSIAMVTSDFIYIAAENEFDVGKICSASILGRHLA